MLENAEEASQFAADFLPNVLKLATDTVPNVRIVAAKTLTKFTESGLFTCLLSSLLNRFYVEGNIVRPSLDVPYTNRGMLVA